MKFTQTSLPSVMLIETEALPDDRGYVARTWCRAEFEEQGLTALIAQCSVSFNWHASTLRGLHYQDAPYEEAKVVRCSRGSIYDVVVDLRPDSPAFLRHVAVVLTADSRNQLYIPEGCAHGYLTLEDNCEIEYQISAEYRSDFARGFRWDDPAFGIPWPAEVRAISERDRRHPPFELRLVESLRGKRLSKKDLPGYAC